MVGPALSVLVHISVILIAVWVDTGFRFEPRHSPNRTLTVFRIEDFPRPRTLFYKNPHPLPEVNPTERIGSSPVAQARNQSPQTLIYDAPNPLSERQLIRTPDPKPIPNDVPAPNVVVTAAERPQPKAFVAPHVQTASPRDVRLAEAAPDLLVKTAAVDPLSLVGKTRLPPKAFVAPPAGSRAAASVADPGTAPPAQLSQTTGSGSGLEAIIISLDPGAGRPPNGSRSARFSNAGTVGPLSSGTPQPGSPSIPGLVSHDPNGPGGAPGRGPLADHAAAPPGSKDRRLVRREIVVPQNAGTMSAPLRPSSRIVPMAVEGLFRSRNLYTLVVPDPNLPGYSGDWVMWFSCRDGALESHVSAPLPMRKYWLAAADGDPPLALSATISFAAVIDRSGHISSPRVLRGPVDTGIRSRALEEFETWEFRPALSNGTAIDVDVVIEIPFEPARSKAAARPTP